MVKSLCDNILIEIVLRNVEIKCKLFIIIKKGLCCLCKLKSYPTIVSSSSKSSTVKPSFELSVLLVFHEVFLLNCV